MVNSPISVRLIGHIYYGGGEGGIRTLVRCYLKLISSQPRYDRFDTSPFRVAAICTASFRQ